jgi:hypothetical protein
MVMSLGETGRAELALRRLSSGYAHTPNRQQPITVSNYTARLACATSADSSWRRWRNCVSAARIAPAWSAFVIDENAARMLRDHYGTDNVYCLDDWDWKPAAALWQRLRSAGTPPTPY